MGIFPVLRELSCRLLRLGPTYIYAELLHLIPEYKTLLFRVALSSSRNMAYPLYTHLSRLWDSTSVSECCALPVAGAACLWHGPPHWLPHLPMGFKCALGAEHVFLGWGFGNDHPSRLFLGLIPMNDLPLAVTLCSPFLRAPLSRTSQRRWFTRCST